MTRQLSTVRLVAMVQVGLWKPLHEGFERVVDASTESIIEQVVAICSEKMGYNTLIYNTLIPNEDKRNPNLFSDLRGKKIIIVNGIVSPVVYYEIDEIDYVAYCCKKNVKEFKEESESLETAETLQEETSVKIGMFTLFCEKANVIDHEKVLTMIMQMYNVMKLCIYMHAGWKDEAALQQ